MKGILTTALLLLIWGLPIIIKAVKESKNPTNKVRTTKPDEFEAAAECDMKTSADLQQNRSNVPKEQEYFTYETLDTRDDISSVCSQSKVDSKSQATVNEEENDYSLTLEEEEIYKGIVYSEIIKKKYN